MHLIFPRAASDCAAGKAYYVCAQGAFRGCCSTDPCGTGICNDNDDDNSNTSTSTSLTPSPTVVTVTSSGSVLVTTVTAPGATNTVTATTTATPSSSSPNSNDGSNKAMIGGIVGGVVGAVFLVLGMVIFGIYIYRRRRKGLDDNNSGPFGFFSSSTKNEKGEQGAMSGESKTGGTPLLNNDPQNRQSLLYSLTSPTELGTDSENMSRYSSGLKSPGMTVSSQGSSGSPTMIRHELMASSPSTLPGTSPPVGVNPATAQLSELPASTDGRVELDDTAVFSPPPLRPLVELAEESPPRVLVNDSPPKPSVSASTGYRHDWGMSSDGGHSSSGGGNFGLGFSNI